MNIKHTIALLNLLVFTNLTLFGQKYPDIELIPFQDTLAPLDMLFVKLNWGNASKNKIDNPFADRSKWVQVRRLTPYPTEWRQRSNGISDLGVDGTSHDDKMSMSYIPAGYSASVLFKIEPEWITDEHLWSKDKIVLGFKPGTYECRYIYFPKLKPGQFKYNEGPFAGDFSCCKVIEFTFTVLDSPPADEVALYDFLVKNDLANYIHHHRYAPENIPLFEEALLLAPETSSLKPFIHQAVADLLTRQLYNAPKPYSDEELAVLYERIVYHMRKVVESKHPYLLQNLFTDLSNYQFELQAVKARLRRK
jgi:hypothetical protein